MSLAKELLSKVCEIDESMRSDLANLAAGFVKAGIAFSFDYLNFSLEVGSKGLSITSQNGEVIIKAKKPALLSKIAGLLKVEYDGSDVLRVKGKGLEEIVKAISKVY